MPYGKVRSVLSPPFVFCPFPRSVLDDWLSHFSPHEWMVYSAITRFSWGKGQRDAELSLDELVRYTGLGQTSVRQALKDLRERRMITVRRIGTGRGHVCIYSIKTSRGGNFISIEKGRSAAASSGDVA